MNQMHSERSVRLSGRSNRHHKHSNSPTLASTHSEKALLPKTFKNQPFPSELKRRLIGRKFQFQDFSDEEEDNSGVVVEEEEIEVHEKKKILPHFQLISDHGQFLATRSRILSERKRRGRSPRCRSVESLRLPQVMEEKKQDDELRRVGRSKLPQFKDRNEFNQHSIRNSDTNSYTDKDSKEHNHTKSVMPELIMQNPAEETKSEKLKRQKSIIDSELEKLVVDELDDKKRKKEDSQQQIESIQEERLEEEIVNKFEHETEMFNKFKEEELSGGYTDRSAHQVVMDKLSEEDNSFEDNDDSN